MKVPKLYSKKIPFWTKTAHNYFAVTALLSMLFMGLKLKTLYGLDAHNPQLFLSNAEFNHYILNLKENVADLKVFYQLDFVFMFGYTGWFAIFIVILNKIKTQPKWLNLLMILLVAGTFLCDIYENSTLLHLLKHPNRQIIGSYFRINYNLKYIFPLLFAVVYCFAYFTSRKSEYVDETEEITDTIWSS